MPRVTKLYEGSRKGLAHNMGGHFDSAYGKVKKVVKELVTPKPKVDEALRKTKYAAERKEKMKVPETIEETVTYDKWKPEKK